MVEVFGIDHRFVRSDDRVGVLKKNDPRHHRMRKTSFRRLVVVLAKIARRVKKLLRDDGRLELDVAPRVNQRLAASPEDTGDGAASPSKLDNLPDRFALPLKTRVSPTQHPP